MTPRAALTPQVAAKALGAWWELAGLEPFDLDQAVLQHNKKALFKEPVIAPNPAPATKPSATRAQASAARNPTDSLAQARAIASACSSVDALEKAVASFEGCLLKTHARATLFAGGAKDAPIMVIGEAPDRDDDESGIPFCGPSGKLLDKMLASIGVSRQTNCCMTYVMPWRPPGDRKPTSDELAICKPFIQRHIELAAPKAILLVGGIAAQVMLEQNDSVIKMRGKPFSYGVAGDIYAQCVLSPAYLLNRPAEKSLMWKDLLRFEAEISVRGVALTH
jgi:uracil-DNA glycosylase